MLAYLASQYSGVATVVLRIVTELGTKPSHTLFRAITQAVSIADNKHQLRSRFHNNNPPRVLCSRKGLPRRGLRWE